ncbi:unnamed protein product, partial [Nesidiocoris tenuis]
LRTQWTDSFRICTKLGNLLHVELPDMRCIIEFSYLMPIREIGTGKRAESKSAMKRPSVCFIRKVGDADNTKTHLSRVRKIHQLGPEHPFYSQANRSILKEFRKILRLPCPPWPPFLWLLTNLAEEPTCSLFGCKSDQSLPVFGWRTLNEREDQRLRPYCALWLTLTTFINCRSMTLLLFICNIVCPCYTTIRISLRIIILQDVHTAKLQVSAHNDEMMIENEIQIIGVGHIMDQIVTDPERWGESLPHTVQSRLEYTLRTSVHPMRVHPVHASSPRKFKNKFRGSAGFVNDSAKESRTFFRGLAKKALLLVGKTRQSSQGRILIRCLHRRGFLAVTLFSQGCDIIIPKFSASFLHQETKSVEICETHFYVGLAVLPRVGVATTVRFCCSRFELSNQERSRIYEFRQTEQLALFADIVSLIGPVVPSIPDEPSCSNFENAE